MSDLDAVIQEAAALYGPSTDAPGLADVPIRWLVEAIVQTQDRGGEAALEIGVRLGGMSAAFCHVASRATQRHTFLVMSVDPYGSIPIHSPKRVDGTIYDEEMSKSARALLAKFDESAYFRMTSAAFLANVLPTYRWWMDGLSRPSTRRFLSFAWVDGQHDPLSVASEIEALIPHMAPYGTIAIDNTEACPEVIDMLSKSDRHRFDQWEEWKGNIPGYEYLRRVRFKVP